MTEGDNPLGDPKRDLGNPLTDAKKAYQDTLATWRRILAERRQPKPGEESQSELTGPAEQRPKRKTEPPERRLRRVEESLKRDPQVELVRIRDEQRRPEVVESYQRFRGLGYDKFISSYMDAFRESPFYEELKRKVEDVMSREGEFHPGEVAGVVFENIAYGLLAAEEEQRGNIVLSPEATHEFYRDNIYPQGEEIEWDFGREFRHNDEDFEDTFVPDGFIVNPEGKIVGIAEYKSTIVGLKRQLARSEGLIRRLRERNLLGSEDPRRIFITCHASAGKILTNVENNVQHNHLENVTLNQFKLLMEPILIELGNISNRRRSERPPQRGE